MSAKAFLRFALEHDAFWMSATEKRVLKSSRESPYFFNSGAFATGSGISQLGRHYADAILNRFGDRRDFDVIFGPAYKGIPLAAETAAALYQRVNVNVGWAHDRKETKRHGEQSDLVGARLHGRRVIVVDDVITTGGTKADAVEFIRRHGGTTIAVVIAFDRLERGSVTDLSAVQQFERDFRIPVISVATARDLINYLEGAAPEGDELAAIRAYQKEYGIAA